MRWLDVLTCWSCDRNLIFSRFIAIAHEIERREQAGRGGVLNSSADVDNREIEQEGSNWTSSSRLVRQQPVLPRKRLPRFDCHGAGHRSRS